MRHLSQYCLVLCLSHKTVPEFSYRRHLQHCKTRNWTCPNCNEVMIQEEKEKHEFMHHQSVTNLKEIHKINLSISNSWSAPDRMGSAKIYHHVIM
jgi:hypothetical protein